MSSAVIQEPGVRSARFVEWRRVQQQQVELALQRWVPAEAPAGLSLIHI